MQVVIHSIRTVLFHTLFLAIVGGLWATASYRAMDHEKQRELASMSIASTEEVAAAVERADQPLSLVVYEPTDREWVDPT